MTIPALKKLEKVSKELFHWFNDNLMKSSPEKSLLIVSTNENDAIRIEN